MTKTTKNTATKNVSAKDMATKNVSAKDMAAKNVSAKQAAAKSASAKKSLRSGESSAVAHPAHADRPAPSAPGTVIAVDWSGRVDPSGQRRHIVAAIWRNGQVCVESGRTRDEVAEWLILQARKDPALVVGFDFCFSFPAWFLREVGASNAPAFWRIAAERGEQWLARGYEDRRFWGKPHKRPQEFSGEQLHRMLRSTDLDCKLIAHIPEEERALRVKGITPKSVFQIGGSGSVGTASLRGMPVLLRLQASGFRIWPFDRPQPGRPLVIEMYSRLNTGPVHKSNPAARIHYLDRKCLEDPAYAALSRTALAKAKAGEDAFDALVSCMVMAQHREQFYALPNPRDPEYASEGWTWAPPLPPPCMAS